MNLLRHINLALALIATFAPMAHLLELPNKLALDGPLWLAVQHRLYRGWGPVIGGPVEIGVLVTTLLLLALDRRARLARALGAGAYAGMLACFFVFNAPVNAALSGWTVETLPADWAGYRARWETGHAIAAALSLFALGCVTRAYFRRLGPAGGAAT